MHLKMMDFFRQLEIEVEDFEKVDDFDNMISVATPVECRWSPDVEGLLYQDL